MIIGIILMVLGAALLVVTMLGAVGYIQRKQTRDAVGVMATIGLAAIAEILLGLTLIF